MSVSLVREVSGIRSRIYGKWHAQDPMDGATQRWWGRSRVQVWKSKSVESWR